MMILFEGLWLLWLFGFLAQAQSTDSEELSKLYFDVLASHAAFPPLDSANWTSGTHVPIQAAIATAILSVDVISPATSEFTVSSQKVMYWNKEACNQTEAHQYACSALIGNIHFLTRTRTTGDSELRFEIHREEAHQAEFDRLGLPGLIPSLDIVEDQVTYKQQFDMRTYPFEYHNLEITLNSLYSSNIVNMSTLPVDAGIFTPSVPAGWTLQDVGCRITSGERTISKISNQDLFFPTYTCVIQVSRQNTGWWITSFMLFLGLNVIAYVSGLGVASHFMAEARDDKDGARQGLFDGYRMSGVFRIGLLLTYVFQVEIAPYGQSAEFWPSTAASTMIYVLGLSGILVFSFLSMMFAFAFKRQLVVDGFNGGIKRTYDLTNLPKEGEVSEEELPLINRQEVAKDELLDEGDAEQPDLTHVGTKETNPSTTSCQQVKADKVDDSVVEAMEAGKESTSPSVEKGDLSFVHEKTPSSRRNTQKIYTVLSVQDAVTVNRLVRLEFAAMTSLMSVIVVAGAIILIVAKSKYQDAIS